MGRTFRSHADKDQGVITTARGKILNMNELKLKNIRSLVKFGDQKDTVTPQKQPVRQMNVQGFMPAMPVSLKKASAVAQQEAIQEEDESPSIADYTGITIDAPRHLKERPKNAADTANETLREIMGDLKEQYQNHSTETQKPSRRNKQ